LVTVFGKIDDRQSPVPERRSGRSRPRAMVIRSAMAQAGNGVRKVVTQAIRISVAAKESGDSTHGLAIDLAEC
jgi:hypothetical protein